MTPGVQIANFFAGDANTRGGIRVVVKDLDGDSKQDLVVGAGDGAASRLTRYLGSTISTGTPIDAGALEVFPGFMNGIFVG